MLTHSSRSYNNDDDIGFIHNYYEKLVLQEIMQQSSRVQVGDREFMADVACVALNRLPPRYIRHNVDMTFFMSPQDMEEIEHKVTNAVALALTYVESRELGENTELAPQSLAAVEATLAKTEASQTKINTALTKIKKPITVKSSDKKSKK